MIVTAADSRFFSLVQGTIRSIRDKPQGQEQFIGFFDLGCTDAERVWLGQWVDKIVTPSWDIPFPGQDQAPGYFKGLFARPFLRDYFPGHAVYLWIDADAWVQDWQAVSLFEQGARLRGLAIVPQIDRGSDLQYGLMFNEWKLMYGWYQADLGDAVAQTLWSYPMLNAGVFALHSTASHWEVWRTGLTEALQRHASHLTDQLVLNWAVYLQGLWSQTEILPAWCNWTCHYGLPRWSPEQGCLVEPYLPHVPIGIIHLTHIKHEKAQVKTIQNSSQEVSLRYVYT